MDKIEYIIDENCSFQVDIVFKKTLIIVVKNWTENALFLTVVLQIMKKSFEGTQLDAKIY